MIPGLRSAPDLPVYFEEFPLPNRAPYAIAVDMGVVRNTMGTGNAKQRRLYNHMPQQFSLAFQLRTRELEVWQFWVNLYAYNWFYMPLASMFSPSANQSPDGVQPRGLISYHITRFITDLAINMIGHDLWEVSVAAEISPEMFANLPRPSGIDRIDGLHPADNLPDSLDGRFPSAPALGGPVDGGELTGVPLINDPNSLLYALRDNIMLGNGDHLITGGAV